MSASDDRSKAMASLALIGTVAVSSTLEVIACATTATVHALLAIEARLAESVEQQKLANVVAALNTPVEDQTALVRPTDYVHALNYVAERIGDDIVNPADSGSEGPQ